MLKNGSNPQNKVESLPFSFKWSKGIAPSPNLMILRHPLQTVDKVGAGA